jgi:twitching motility protein PilU
MTQLVDLLKRTRELGASDLLLSTQAPPAYRVHGKLIPREGEPISRQALEGMVNALLSEHQQTLFAQRLEMNLAHRFPDLGRFRINVFRQRGHLAMAIRAIPLQIPGFEELGLPEKLRELAMLKRGLILMVGGAGSGKSTTLAVMLEQRNRNDRCHIITVEDPIEYTFRHQESMVNQREVGLDTQSYHQALMNALRQSPDVLMIGEIRDREAMERAIEFADTGHLCLSTLHANSANQAFDRIINLFQEHERAQVLLSLSANLRGIFSQRLVPTRAGGRIGAYELLVNTPLVSDLIRRGEVSALKETMEKDEGYGMISFDQSLYARVREGLIEEATALEYADSPSNLRLKFRLEGQGESLSLR